MTTPLFPKHWELYSTALHFPFSCSLPQSRMLRRDASEARVRGVNPSVAPEQLVPANWVTQNSHCTAPNSRIPTCRSQCIPSAGSPMWHTSGTSQPPVHTSCNFSYHHLHYQKHLNEIFHKNCFVQTNDCCMEYVFVFYLLLDSFVLLCWDARSQNVYSLCFAFI